MKQFSAGLLVYRPKNNSVEVLIVHPGGPFWARKDLGAWSLPKGQYVQGEEPFAAARREFAEEIGQPAPDHEATSLGEVKLKSGKTISAWAVPGDLDAENIKSNPAQIEWPPRSGKKLEFPEVDRAGWFDLSTAMQKLHPAQAEFVTRLAEHLGVKTKKPADLPEQSSLF